MYSIIEDFHDACFNQQNQRLRYINIYTLYIDNKNMNKDGNIKCFVIFIAISGVWTADLTASYVRTYTTCA